MASDTTGRRALRMTIALIAALVTPAADARSRDVLLGETVAVNTHYGAPRDPVDPAALARLSAAGVRRIRNDLDWAAIERTPGVYDFATPGIDELVTVAERAGLRVLFILDYGNPLHGPERAVVSDAGRRAFTAFAVAAATRCR